MHIEVFEGRLGCQYKEMYVSGSVCITTFKEVEVIKLKITEAQEGQGKLYFAHKN